MKFEGVTILLYSIRNRVPRTFYIFIVLTSLLFLASCNFEMNGEVNIGADGAGEIVTNVSIEKKAYHRMPSDKKARFCKEIDDSGKLGEVEIVAAGENVICRFKRPFTNIKQLKEDGFKVRLQDDGTVELSIDLKTIASAVGLKANKNDQSLEQTMLMAIIAKKSLNITVNAPHIVETNGVISEDKKSAEYGVPMLELVGIRANNPTLLSECGTHPDIQSVIGFDFNNGGREKAVSTTQDNRIQIWEVCQRPLFNTMQGHSSAIMSSALTQNGKNLITGSKDNSIKIWDIETGRLMNSMEKHTGAVMSVSISPDGTQILSGSLDNTVKLWKTSTGDLIQIFKGHTDEVTSIAFSPNGKSIVSGSSDKTIKLWDSSTGQLIRTMDQSSTKGELTLVSSVRFSPDGTQVAAGYLDNTIRLWDINTGHLLKALEGHTNAVTTLAFSPNGKLLLSGSYDNTVKIWDLESHKLINSMKKYPYPVTLVAFNPNGTRFVSVWGTKAILIWETPKKQLFKTRFYCYENFWGSKKC